MELDGSRRGGRGVWVLGACPRTLIMTCLLIWSDLQQLCAATDTIKERNERRQDFNIEMALHYSTPPHPPPNLQSTQTNSKTNGVLK